VRVGYLGPEGTFSHQALLAASPHELPAIEPVPLASNHDVVVAVQDGRVDRALAPIESAREGAVGAVLDALAFDAPSIYVVGEHVEAVRHCLVAAPGTPIEAIETIASHPQALAQCAAYLRERLPDVELLAATSTARAVREVAGARGAIGTRLAAELYGAHILAEAIEDDAGNATRFVWLARTPAPPPRAATAAKTSLLFYGAGDASPGWLVRCLSEFAFRGVNLSKIESRPLRSQLGHYLFHVDLDGHVEEEPVAGAVDALRAHCEEVRVLGSYELTSPVVGSATLPIDHGGHHSA
jgi:prephenate dehydratase